MDSRVLLVHGDPGILRALEAGLRSEGFEVQTSSTGSEGWKIFHATRPGMVVTDVDVGELDGFTFASRLRQDPIGKIAAVIVIDGSRAAGRRLRAIEAGADSRLVGPDPTKEVMTRARLLFGSPNREAASGTNTAPRGFACDLADLDVLDLVALVQRNGRSGVGSLTAQGRVAGSLFFDQGRLIDAQSGHASGLEAFHRLACWTGGALNLEWRNFRRRDVLARPPGDLVTSGLAHLEQWTDLLDRLATPNTVFRVDLDALIDRLSSTFGQLTEVLNACDGVRSVVQIVDECSIGALDVLRSLLRLRDEGLISDPGQPARTDKIRPNLEATLMGGGGVAQLPVAAPLGPRVPNPTAPGPRRLPPAVGGSRLTAPLGQAGLPVSVTEAKKLPAVTMQFSSGMSIPRRDPVSAEAPRPPAPAQPQPAQAQTGQPTHEQAPQPQSAQPESPQPRLTTSRPLPPRLRPAPPQAQPAPPSTSPLKEAERPERALAQDPVDEAPRASTELAQQPATQPALAIARPQPIARLATADDAPAPAPFSGQPAPLGSEPRRPEMDQNRPLRPTDGVDSNATWDPVWPQAALSPPEPATALTAIERDRSVATVESPTVYLPARPADARPAPERPAPARQAPARQAPARAKASRRPAPHAEGIRQRPGDESARRRDQKNLPWWQHHRLALLMIGASVLLGALVAIGVALVHALQR